MWTGRVDSDRKERLHQFVANVSLDDIPINTNKALAFVGFASDEGVRRNQGCQGAKEGPQAIRNALGTLPFYNRGLSLYEIGDIECVDKNLEDAQERLAETVANLHKKNVLPIVLGGGHEVAWGHFQGIARQRSLESIAIVNFDAHLDMRPFSECGSSGTPFLQIAKYMEESNNPFNYTCIGLQPTGNTVYLIETAKNHKVQAIVAEEIHLTGIESTFRMLESVISNHEYIYVTVCLDVFASPYAPGVSAPQPLGITPWQMIPLLRLLAKSGKVISLDIAELAPRLDQNNITAKLAGNLVFDFLHQIKM